MNLGRLGMHGIPAGGVTIYPMAPWLASQGHATTVSRRRGAAAARAAGQ